jgi:poly(3-hydroxybutyrate) depolymerase
MNKRYLGRLRKLAIAAFLLILFPCLSLAQPENTRPPDRRTLVFHGVEREYFVQLPPSFDRDKSYWLLVVMGGTNGRAFFLANGISRVVGEAGFDAIVVSPSFPNDYDVNLIRFPALGEGAFLEEVIKALRTDYRLKPKILLTGYSRGGQFAHRFALAYPGVVEAVAPFASGTWTTPGGRFLVEELGEVRDPRKFLAKAENASTVPDRLRDLFNPKVAAVADSKAVTGSHRIPFLVMCGTLDPRLPIAKEFVRSLEDLRYRVEVEWPKTPHVCNKDCPAELKAEFEKYSQRAVAFFQRISQGK